VVTGTRAEYGLLKSLMHAVQQHRRLSLQLVVTGMHLLPQFGSTWRQVARDGWRIDAKVPMYYQADRREHLPAALGREVSGLGKALSRLGSDVVVVLGDRLEALGAAIAALAGGQVVAHIHGGDRASGEMDECVRFAITKLAHLHFAATPQSRRRILAMGEDPKCVFSVGMIGLDEIFDSDALKRFDRAEVLKRWNLQADSPVLVVLQHPAGFGADTERRHMLATLGAVRAHQGVILAPNVDPGYTGILRAIKQFTAANKRWRFVESLPRRDYLQLLAAADVLVGNSSSGILEANAVSTAAVNVGPRQAGRERNGRAIIDCDYGTGQVRHAVRAALKLSDLRKIRPFKRFGNGGTGRRIAEILARAPLGRTLRVKQCRI